MQPPQFEVITSDGRKHSTGIDRFPDQCPICHRGIQPILHHGYLCNNDTNIQVVFRCPRIDCENLFIGYYIGLLSQQPWRLERTAPNIPKTIEFSDEIRSISPSFIEIFNQASSAETLELNEICGTGYRKALEFLIKAFVILRDPSKREEVEGTVSKKGKDLAKVIKENVEDANVKRTAELATWLGNDETHYKKRWTDMDIKDLKRLIDITVRWIESDEMTRAYEETMRSR